MAYDLFLKGRDLYFQGTTESFDKAIPYFKQAVERDPKFALAYAGVAMLDYYRDIFHTEQTHSAEMIAYADKAMLYDSKLAESLVAKAMVYMLKKDYESAVPYLEQALEYNPNSALVIHFLADLYNLSLPNAPKYLEYALKGLQLDVADSSTTSYTYLHVSNALVQTGFIDEALTYINKSLAYNPKNPFSGYLKPFILFAKSKDAEQTKKLLQVELRKDSNRVDVLTVLASVYYSTRDYDAAYGCYKKIIAIRESQHLDLFKNENLAMGIVYHKKGLHEKGDELIKSFKDFADHDRSLYKNLHLTFYYCYKNDVATAMKHLRLFSKEDNFQYWVLLLPNEPTLDPIKDLPEFKDIMRTIDKKFWDRHDVIKERLEEQGLL